jgi:hypothetical protein
MKDPARLAAVRRGEPESFRDGLSEASEVPGAPVAVLAVLGV